MVFTVSCPDCQSEFPVDSAKVPEAGVNAQCSMCPGTFFVERPTETVDDGFEDAFITETVEGFDIPSGDEDSAEEGVAEVEAEAEVEVEAEAPSTATAVADARLPAGRPPAPSATTKTAASGPYGMTATVSSFSVSLSGARQV